MAKQKPTGKEARFLKALLSGKTISRKQAKTQYKLGNPSATVLRIDDKTIHTVKRQYVTKRARVNGLMRDITVVKYSI